MTKAAMFASAVLKEFILPEIEMIVDEDKKVKHSDLAERADEVFLEPSRARSKVWDALLFFAFEFLMCFSLMKNKKW